MLDVRDHHPALAARRGEIIRGRYVLQDLLGKGGMGVVYAAVHTVLGHTVAIKVPKPALATNLAVHGQFATEALTGAQIHHPNVVGVFDFGHHAGAPFLVMEHVAGPRLGELLVARGALPLDLALELVRQALAGLADVHACGVVHGDVKPDNILVETRRDGSSIPRLMDFGLARFAAQPWLVSDEPIVAGTPDYVAPELVHGAPTSFASDVYAMGMLCYELVTGETPFGGGPGEVVLQRQVSDLAPPMSCRRPAVPHALDAFVERALAKDPLHRFPDAQAMFSELAVLLRRLGPLAAFDEPGCPILIASDEPTAPLRVRRSDGP